MNRMRSYSPPWVPLVQPSPPLAPSPVLTSSSARSWQAATGEDDLSLYFPGRSSSSNKGISFFFLSSLSLLHPLSFPFPTFFLLHLPPPSPSIWRGLLFSLPLSLTVFLLNDRPFTAVSDDVAGARRFLRETRVSFALLYCSLFLSHALSLSLSPFISSSFYHWLSLPALSTPVTSPS